MFSTMKPWPNTFWKCALMSRACPSAALPAGNGTIRQIRQRAEPAVAGMRDGLDHARLHLPDRRRAIGEEEIHLSTDHVVQRRPAAAIRNVIDLHAGHVPEHFQREMLHRAVAGRREID